MQAIRFVLPGALLALFFLVPSGVSAEAEVSRDSELRVITPSKRAQHLSDAPARVIVVTSREIAARGYRTLRDLLQDVPGIELQRSSSAEYQRAECVIRRQSS